MWRSTTLAPLRGVEKMRLDDLRAWFGRTLAVKGVTLPIVERRVTAIIGPSGCGKSTLIRCLNRLHELAPEARVAGRVLLDGSDIYRSDLDVTELRRRVGLVFQQPLPFPTMSIADNVLFGLRLHGLTAHDPKAVVERLLRRVGLWNEVRGSLRRSGVKLSGGQQQRLCIARALALEPEVLLLDEPCSALDPMATLRIEELIHELAEQVTIVIVTHNLQQASRVSHFTAFLFEGELIEYADTPTLFTRAQRRRTEDYLTGRFS